MIKILRFVFHPCLVSLAAMYCFEPIQIVVIASIVLSAEIYFHHDY